MHVGEGPEHGGGGAAAEVGSSKAGLVRPPGRSGNERLRRLARRPERLIVQTGTGPRSNRVPCRLITSDNSDRVPNGSLRDRAATSSSVQRSLLGGHHLLHRALPIAASEAGGSFGRTVHAETVTAPPHDHALAGGRPGGPFLNPPVLAGLGGPPCLLDQDSSRARVCPRRAGGAGSGQHRDLRF